jgi:hypothetical protein
MVYELLAYNTDCRFNDIRYRDYTTSKKKAEKFAQIPEIQFTDSGHGIVFVAREHKGRRKPIIKTVSGWVSKHIKKGGKNG